LEVVEIPSSARKQIQEFVAVMTMMHYNHPYYRRFFESGGFVKVRDYHTAEIQKEHFRMPEKIQREAEIDRLAQDLMLVSKPSLIKILYHDDQLVGFLFAFPDISAALQRARGRLGPIRLVELLTEAGRQRPFVLRADPHHFGFGLQEGGDGSDRRHDQPDARRHADPGRSGLQDPQNLQAGVVEL
jgi:hypothetical protein